MIHLESASMSDPLDLAPQAVAVQKASNDLPATSGTETRKRRNHGPFLPSEGIKMTLLEEGLLAGAGVLRGGKPSLDAYGLSESSIVLFLAVAGAMPEGLNRQRVPKHLANELEAHLVPLMIQELVEWLRDARGRQTRLILSWKGQETLDAARPKKPMSWSARRRAQVRGSANT